MSLLAKQYYTAGYNEEGYIFIDHVEPWKGSRRTENVVKISTEDIAQEQIEKMIKIMNMTLETVNIHSKEIKEYYGK